MVGDIIHDAAIEAATSAVYDHPMPDGDALAVLIHCSECVPGDIPIGDQLSRTRETCAGIAKAAVAAYEAAQWHPGLHGAPHDTEIVAWSAQLGRRFVEWDDDHRGFPWTDPEGRGYFADAFTHWRLPPPLPVAR